MATYTTRQKKTVREEVVLPLPSNMTELDKAFRAATYSLSAECISDETFTVTANEEELVISWEVPDGTK